MTSNFVPLRSSVNTPALMSYDIELELRLLVIGDRRLLGILVHMP